MPSGFGKLEYGICSLRWLHSRCPCTLENMLFATVRYALPNHDDVNVNSGCHALNKSLLN